MSFLSIILDKMYLLIFIKRIAQCVKYLGDAIKTKKYDAIHIQRLLQATGSIIYFK